MNSLEKYVQDHKSLFEEEPAAGHFERLQEKMIRESRQTVMLSKKTSIALRWSMSIAASITILFLAGIVWQNSTKVKGTMLCENAIDVKVCYLDKMNIVAGQIEAHIKDFDYWDQQEVMNDVQNIIASADSDFESKLPEELSEDVAKAILADFYRQNLEGLETIVNSIINQ